MPYRVIRSDRRTLSLQITREGEVLVRAPRRATNASIEAFVKQHRVWIERRLASHVEVEPMSEEERTELLTKAKSVLPERLAYWAAILKVEYSRVSVRLQRTRWGSCGANGAISLNALLITVPAFVCDYVLVHELCHRRELNHSRNFWKRVCEVFPRADEARAWLKAHEQEYIGRIPSTLDKRPKT